MKTVKDRERVEIQGRRRLLGLLGGVGLLGLALPWTRRAPAPQARQTSLKEADFYRPHNLAG